MSRITNSDFAAGNTVQAAEVNTKFTDVATATGSINDENTHSGSIDVTHLPNTSMLVKNSGVKTLPSPVTVNNRIAPATATLLTLDFSSTPSVVSTDDLTRMYYQIWVSETTTSGEAPSVISLDQKGGMFWVCWLEYATDSGLTTWLPVKGQEAPTTHSFGHAPTSAHGLDFGTSSEEKQSSLMMIPHVFAGQMAHEYSTGGSSSQGVQKHWDSSNSERRNYSSMRGYAHTGASYTMYGLRIQVAGLFAGNFITAGGTQNGGLRLMDGTWPLNPGLADNEATITFQRAQLAFMHMKEE